MQMQPNGRGIELPVPNLGALGNQQIDPSVWVQSQIYQHAGVEPDGRALVVTSDGDVMLDGFAVVVMTLPAALIIVSVTGKDQEGRSWSIPWHAVRGITSVGNG